MSLKTISQESSESLKHPILIERSNLITKKFVNKEKSLIKKASPVDFEQKIIEVISKAQNCSDFRGKKQGNGIQVENNFKKRVLEKKTTN